MKSASPIKMLRALFLAVMLGLVSAPTMAQELAPEHLALARQYVDLTDQASIFEVTVVQMGIDTMRTLITQNPTEAAQIDTAIGTVIQDYRGRKGELLDQFARVYALRFTMAELQEIVAFYLTPTGTKLRENGFAINQEIQQVMSVYRNNLQTEFLAKTRAVLRDAGLNM